MDSVDVMYTIGIVTGGCLLRLSVEAVYSFYSGGCLWKQLLEEVWRNSLVAVCGGNHVDCLFGQSV